jgi:hypothetical protein
VNINILFLKTFRMNFFPFEKEALEKRFNYEKATIEDDFDGYEIEAINTLNMLKNNSYVYLG